MISRISGVIDQFSDNTLTVGVGGVSYEVMIPTAVMRGMNEKLSKESPITLITYHYHQTDPSKSIPVLIGFSNAIEKEFFEKFITVSGVGPKAAVRALSEPIPAIAQAIDAGDIKFLKSLPGIGEQKGKEIIAKLQGKMGKFGLIQGGAEKVPGASLSKDQKKDSLIEEALEVLLQLQYKKDEARIMIEKAYARNASLSSSEEILNEVYRQRKKS